MSKTYTYHGVTFAKRLTADEQRSFSMLLRTKSWGSKVAKSSISETVAPVAPTKPKPVTTTKPKLVVLSNDDDIDAIIAKVFGAMDTPKKAKPTATKKAAKTTTKWDEVKAEWDATREAGTYTCSCGKVFAALGSPEKGGALFHKAWTKAKGIYGKGEDHFIPTIK